MGELFDQLPENIQEHIRIVAKDFEIPDAEDTLEAIAGVWTEKKKIFENRIERANLEDVDALGKDDEDSALAMTYSGSLIDIGPIIDNSRKITYASIGYRISTPEHAESGETNLACDLMVDNTAEFTNGPIRRSSQIYKIAVCKGDMAPEEKASNITNTKTIIEDEFIEANKTIDLD